MFGVDARFDHVAHAARSITSLLPLYRDLLGGEFIGGGDNPRLGFRTVQLRFAGGGRVELLEPLANSCFLESFMRRSPAGGLHHVTFKVDDIEEALSAVRSAGLEPFGVNLEQASWRELFVHPREAHGTLIQLASSEVEWDPATVPPPPISLEDFLEQGGVYFGP
ncbi:MAG: VOC family protein [Actinomycetota bacterium]|nr:VOC family protein [Actinomycetota bacterium]